MENKINEVAASKLQKDIKKIKCICIQAAMAGNTNFKYVIEEHESGMTSYVEPISRGLRPADVIKLIACIPSIVANLTKFVANELQVEEQAVITVAQDYFEATMVSVHAEYLSREDVEGSTVKDIVDDVFNRLKDEEKEKNSTN